MNCIKCGADITLPATFCPKCGATQAAPTRACPHCGVSNPTTGRFCNGCGASQTLQPEMRQWNANQGFVTPLPYGSPAAIGGMKLKRNLDGSFSLVKARRIPRALLVLGAVVIVLVLVITLIGVFQQQNSPSTAMGTRIGFDALWEKAYNSGSESGSGLEIGKRYEITASTNENLTELTSATSVYDHNAIYGGLDLDGDDDTQYDSFLQAYKESERDNRHLVCHVVVSMGVDHKFRFHRV